MAEINLEAEVMQCVRNGIAKAIQERMSTNYNNPFEKVIASAIDSQQSVIRELMVDGIKSALNDAEFRESLKTAMRSKLAGLLVQRFGGEMEKQVNALKSDPSTRARITVAIDEILKSKA